MSEYNRHKWAMEWMHGGGRDPNGRSLDDEIRIGKEDWMERQRVAQGGRIGFGSGGSKQSAEAAALKYYNEAVDEFGEDALNEAAQFLEGKNYSELKGDKYANIRDKIRYEIRTHGSVLGESESRKRSAKARAISEADLKIKLLEATQGEGFFDSKKFRKENKITLKQLKIEATQLQKDIYLKRGIRTGTKTKSTLEWIPQNDFQLDNTLSKTI